MRYMGGKSRQSKQIVEILRRYHGEGFNYFEPFCGGMSSAAGVIKGLNPKRVVLSDVNESLINMWVALTEDKVTLPDTVTDELYNHYKLTQDVNDPLTAWYGHAVSFGGKWFGGLARNERGKMDSYDFSPQVRTTMKKVDALKKCGDLVILHKDYRFLLPLVAGWVVYCDPPYEGTTKAYNLAGEFDYVEFWDLVRAASEKNAVYVSCFDCPDDFEVLHSWGDTVIRHHAAIQANKNIVSEKLVRMKKGDI